jgi:uncharacterized protein
MTSKSVLNRKLKKLKGILGEFDKLAIAFSGGVDSTFLLKVAYEVLGNKVMAIFIDSPLQPQREKAAVHKLIHDIGCEMLIMEADELHHPAFRNNPPDRCYYCKGLIFDNLMEVAHLRGIYSIADGSNRDDTRDFRPGAKALRERNIRSPLQEAGLTKDDIRILSREYSLPTWDKDALACLATRIPFGEAVTKEKLIQVDQIEGYLIEQGFRNVRARHQGKGVLIEVRKDQVSRLQSPEIIDGLEQKVKSAGFSRLKIAPEGYVQGRMNPQ